MGAEMKIGEEIAEKKLGGADNSPNPSALRDLRKSKGLALQDVAAAAGIRYRKLAEVEGRRVSLSGRMAVRIAKALGADAFDLLALRYREETGDLLANARAHDAENSLEYRRLRDAMLLRLRERVADARRAGWSPTVSRYPGAISLRIFNTSDPDENLRFVGFMDAHGNRAVSEILDSETGVYAVYVVPVPQS